MWHNIFSSKEFRCRIFRKLWLLSCQNIGIKIVINEIWKPVQFKQMTRFIFWKNFQVFSRCCEKWFTLWMNHNSSFIFQQRTFQFMQGFSFRNFNAVISRSAAVERIDQITKFDYFMWNGIISKCNDFSVDGTFILVHIGYRKVYDVNDQKLKFFNQARVHIFPFRS